MKNPLLLTATLFTLSTSLIFATDTTWISTSSQTWGTPGNWSAGSPGASLGAMFTNNTTVQHTIDVGSTPTAVGITFNSSGGSAGFVLGSSGTQSGLTLRATFTTALGIVNNDTFTQVFNSPFILNSPTGTTGNGASQTWNAAGGGITLSGNYSGAVSTIDNKGGRLTIGGGFDTTIGTTGRGDIVGIGGLTKNGAGTLTLGGTTANTYSGTTILNAGSIVAAKANAFGTSALTLNGGTLNTGGFNQTFGTLTLTAESTLDLGSGSSNPTFANSSAIAWTGPLHILDWTEGSDSIRVGTTSGGLTFSQLSTITWDIPGINATGIDANGFLVPIPEPSTAVLSLLGGFGLAATIINRRRKA